MMTTEMMTAGEIVFVVNPMFRPRLRAGCWLVAVRPLLEAPTPGQRGRILAALPAPATDTQPTETLPTVGRRRSTVEAEQDLLAEVTTTCGQLWRWHFMGRDLPEIIPFGNFSLSSYRRSEGRAAAVCSLAQGSTNWAREGTHHGQQGSANHLAKDAFGRLGFQSNRREMRTRELVSDCFSLASTLQLDDS